MKIAFSATNPCHLHPIAQAVAAAGTEAHYYSGYPAWKLPAPGRLQVRTHAWRTTAVYALLKLLPERLRPPSRSLFLWQDHGFDLTVSRHLQAADFIHGLPGQCLETFRAARRLGMRRVLNHATGPVREWVRIMEPEYRRIGLRLDAVCPYDDAYFHREAEEYALADFHCAASTVVRDQLLAQGIEPQKIWLIPYGADPAIFHRSTEPPPAGFCIIFAGQIGVRKGVQTLLEALTIAPSADWTVDFYGARLNESQADLTAYRGAARLVFHGPVSQIQLGEAFRRSSLLVLPSLEEGFGLVVPQALHCGLPCIVSDQVGAKDLLHPRENGSIFPVRNAAALAAELSWWAAHPRRVPDSPEWTAPARTLIALSEQALPAE